MNRTQKLKMNTRVSLLTRIVMIISGLILPRLILLNYGAETHGLINSISQFLGIITFLDLGVGAVVKSALYRPLAERNLKQLNSVLKAAKNYFQKISYLLVIYVIGLILFYPFLIESPYSYLGTSFLIIALSISQFGQYYFGLVNELLLSANQQDYIQLGSEIIVVILNLIISIILIYIGSSIQGVKLTAGFVYLLRPLILKRYVNKEFDIDYDIKIEGNPLPQKWNGLGQHVAYFIQNNTDIVVLTIFSTLENISVYSIYNMVVASLKQILHSLTSGIQAFFGDIYVNNEIKLLNFYFDRIEWVVHTVVVFLYGMTIVLINPFIEIYTLGVEEISYDAPLFSLLIVLASGVYSLRIPYNSMILSAGHFRQTQLSSLIEAGINIVISVTLVTNFGLIGIAIGTLVSMSYRIVYMVTYLSRNIIYRSISKFVKHIIVDLISLVLILLIGILLLDKSYIKTIGDWGIFATKLGVISLIILMIINHIFYKEIMNYIVSRVFKKDSN